MDDAEHEPSLRPGQIRCGKCRREILLIEAYYLLNDISAMALKLPAHVAVCKGCYELAKKARTPNDGKKSSSS